MPAIRTDKELFSAIRAIDCALHEGMVCSKVCGEYRVNFKGANEVYAYYTNDREDALLTAQAMARQGMRPVDQTAEAGQDTLAVRDSATDTTKESNPMPTESLSTDPVYLALAAEAEGVTQTDEHGHEWRDVYLDNARDRLDDMSNAKWRGELSRMAKVGLYRGDATGDFGMVRVK